MKELSTMEENTPVEIVKSVCDPDIPAQREKLDQLEAILKTHEQAEIPVKHRFSGGIYAREITIPKGTLLTGRIHKFDHFDIMLSGDMTVSTDSGDVKRLSGLNIMEGTAGKKRAGFAHEDTHWITFHCSDERDPEEMYEYLTCGSFEELDQFNIMVDQADYRVMISNMSMTEEQIQAQVQNEDDMITLPDEYDHLIIGPSLIHGEGLFSNKSYQGGDVLCPSRIGDMRTIAGRYTNHSFNPNAAMVVTNSGVDLVALKEILPGQEITVSYREVLGHRSTEGDLCQQ